MFPSISSNYGFSRISDMLLIKLHVSYAHDDTDSNNFFSSQAQVLLCPRMFKYISGCVPVGGESAMMSVNIVVSQVSVCTYCRSVPSSGSIVHTYSKHRLVCTSLVPFGLILNVCHWSSCGVGGARAHRTAGSLPGAIWEDKGWSDH